VSLAIPSMTDAPNAVVKINALNASPFAFTFRTVFAVVVGYSMVSVTNARLISNVKSAYQNLITSTQTIILVFLAVLVSKAVRSALVPATALNVWSITSLTKIRNAKTVP
jgi:hypothetical protein